MSKDDLVRLLTFYACDTLTDLVEAQAAHVELLQEKLQKLQRLDPVLRRVRGG